MEFTQRFPKSQLGIRNPGYVNVVLSKNVISVLVFLTEICEASKAIASFPQT